MALSFKLAFRYTLHFYRICLKLYRPKSSNRILLNSCRLLADPYSMKITDQGLEHILSLGLIQETNVKGLYKIYSWQGIDYYAGPCQLEREVPREAVFIALEKRQSKKLIQKKLEQNEEIFDLTPLKNFYSSLCYLELDPKTQNLKAKQVEGQNEILMNLECSLDQASPFKIVKDTFKPFHGKYSPVHDFDLSLDSCGQEKEKLWITAYPVTENYEFKGVLAGFSYSEFEGDDIFENFEKVINLDSAA